MSNPIITVENLGKKYLIRHESKQKYLTLRDQITKTTKDFIKNFHAEKHNSENEEFWALKNISFEVNQGDRIGIIGRNGAGKSTLLKILSRITEPTAGKVRLKGRVVSLLEVGTGFHPELSGRENIFLNGAILGMTRAEIKNKFDEIVAFAEVEKFLDTPVKHYSSGMYVRLAFAVAAHLESEILLVDEVLAVGDAQFQKKCLGKMEEVSQKQGRTVLFVSHNMQALSNLTQKSLILSNGKINFYNDTSEAISRYFFQSNEGPYIYTDEMESNSPKISKVEVITSEKNNVQIWGKPMEILFEIKVPRPIHKAYLGFHIINQYQQDLTYIWYFDSKSSQNNKNNYHYKCIFPKTHFYKGQYKLKVYFGENFGKENFKKIDDICPFNVILPSEFNEIIWYDNSCLYTEEFKWINTSP